MIARVSKALAKKEGDKGFTLVELLVVVIIIGILAAIAVPLYLNQQNKAKDSAAKADLATIRTAVVAAMTENPTASEVSWSAVTASTTGGESTITAGTGDDAVTTKVAVSPGNALAANSVNMKADPIVVAIAVTSATGKTFETDANGKITEK